jgi:hypothetical protein
MINCRYIEINEKTLFLKVINSKKDRNAVILYDIKCSVLTLYSEYLNNFNSLQSKKNSHFISENQEVRDALQHCYNGPTAISLQIRSKIFDSQPDVLKSLCPFCMIGEPKTLDHYIGQTEFPEYSILVKNLIPCCEPCQKKKGNRWRKNLKRRFIHYYNDGFLNISFLRASLFIQIGVPQIVFSLNRPSSMSEDEFQIVQWHFEDLDLFDRYVNKCIPIISSELDVLRGYKTIGLSNDQILETLIIKRNSLVLEHGVNYYEAVLYETLSTEFNLLISIL